MVLDNALDGDGACDAKILATDISARMMQRARSGVFPQSRLGNLSNVMLHKYFTAETRPAVGDQTAYAVGPVLRKLICFRKLNLMDHPWPFNGNFDFIFCRNVMIYFDQPTQDRLISRYWDRLDSGGLLFTGHSESLTAISHRFKYVEPSIYEKP
jgi:chemotaxis protein methyltransferase CheR